MLFFLCPLLAVSLKLFEVCPYVLLIFFLLSSVTNACIHNLSPDKNKRSHSSIKMRVSCFPSGWPRACSQECHTWYLEKILCPSNDTLFIATKWCKREISQEKPVLCRKCYRCHISLFGAANFYSSLDKCCLTVHLHSSVNTKMGCTIVKIEFFQLQSIF